MRQYDTANGIQIFKYNNFYVDTLKRYDPKDNTNLDAFENGKTGYPFIDSGIRQLKREGWIPHIVRSSLACP